MKSQEKLVKEFVTRVENIEDEEQILRDDKKEIFKEAKARGLDPKALKEVVRRRKQDPQELETLESTIEIYMDAVE